MLYIKTIPAEKYILIQYKSMLVIKEKLYKLHTDIKV